MQTEAGLGAAPVLGSVESSLGKSHRALSEEEGRGREGTGVGLHWGRIKVLEGGASSSPAAHWLAGACPRNVKLLPITQGQPPPLQSPQCDFCQEGKAFIDVTENGHLRTCMNSMRSHRESW